MSEDLKKKFKKRTIVLISIIIAFVLLLSIFIGVLFILDSGKITRNIFVNGENFGGMTKEEAINELTVLETNMAQRDMVVLADGESIPYKLSDFGFSYDKETTINAAFQVSKDGNFFHNAFDKIALLFGHNIHFSPTINLDKVSCDAIDIELAEKLGGAIIEHIITITDKYVEIEPGKSGIVSQDNCYDKVSSALEANKFETEYTLVIEEPSPIDLDKLAAQVYTMPKDASYGISNYKIVFSDEENGRELDIVDAKNVLNRLESDGPAVKINILKIKPEITTLELKSKLFKDQVSTSSSWYNSKLIGRSVNVELAAKHINGAILAPGEEFSYNKIVGERTAARGFKNAQVYANNEVVEGMGGGICQVSSTLYNTIIQSDLKIIERRNHSLPVSYVPLGQDATVAYGSIDFRFSNNRSYPVQIVATAKNGDLIISLNGNTDTDAVKKEVKLTNETIEVLKFTEKVVEDKTLKPGERVVVSEGKKGYVVNTYISRYEDGKLVSKEFLHKSKYNPTAQKVRVNSDTPLPAVALPTPTPKVPVTSQIETSLPTDNAENQTKLDE